MAETQAAMLKSSMDDGNLFISPNANSDNFREWLADRSHFSLFFIFFYIFFVFGGQAMMQKRKPLPLSSFFLVWNVALALFSICGTICVLPEFIHILRRRGFFASYCEIGDSFYKGSNGYWVYLFHLSKLFEFGDTVFLVLRKRPVIFLHWYHHVTVLAYTWFTYQENVGATRWGVMMNFFIHAVMYSYYAIKSARLPCPKFVAPVITSSQIIQFVIGTYICTHQLYVITVYGSNACDTTLLACVTSVFLYISYFALFAKFFFHSYVDSNSLSNKFVAGNGKKVE